MDRNFEAVQAFHNKMGVPRLPRPGFLDEATMQFRLNFLKEEVAEIEEAMNRHTLKAKLLETNIEEYSIEDYHENLHAVFDGLIDLAYVTFGMADMMGLPWEEGFDLVQRANMQKELAKSAEHSASSTGRGHRLDVVKPPGWTKPDLMPLLGGQATQGKGLGSAFGGVDDQG